jgi:hypothetical protein
MEKESFEHRISTLQVELDSCMKDIVEHVSSLYAPENIPTNLRNDPRNAVKILHHDVLDVLRAAQDRASYREKFASDIDNCKSLMDVIEKVSICSEKIAKCDDAVSGTDVRLASKLIEEVRVAVDALPGPNTEIGTGAVCSILRKEARTLKARFHAKLRRLLGNCIVCECGRVTVTKRLKGMVRGCGEDLLLVEDGIELSDIWAALISIDGAEESVSGVVESIWGTLLRPLWKERKALTPSTFSNDERAEIVFDNIVRDHALSSSSSTSTSSSATSAFSGGSSSDPAMMGGIHAMSLMGIGPCKMPLSQLLDLVAQVLVFTSSEIFCSNEDVSSIKSNKFTTLT